MSFAAQLQPYAWLWWTVAFAYNPAVHIVQSNAHLLKRYTAFIRLVWGLWNAALAIFSLVGFSQTFRAYFAMLDRFPSLCQADSPAAAALWADHYTGATGSWVLYFIVSKVLELLDTVFLAALGKPIIFLHWYHHLTILVYMYLGGINWHPYMISGVAWNYLVHTVMYSYYASSCFSIRWPKAIAQQITTLQLTQMFANLALLVVSSYCCGFNYHLTAWPTAVMYSSYAWLFMGLFGQKYGRKTNDAAKSAAAPVPWHHYITIGDSEYDVTAFIKRHPGGGVIKAYIGKDATAAFREFHSNSKKAARVLASLPKRASGFLEAGVTEETTQGVDSKTRSTYNAGDAKKDVWPVRDQQVPLGDSGPAAAAVLASNPAVNSGQQSNATDHTHTDKDAKSDSDGIQDPFSAHDRAVMADFAAWRASLVNRGLFRSRPARQLAWMLAEPLIFTAAACALMKWTGSLLGGVLLISMANVRCGWIQHEGGHNSLTGSIKVDKLIQTLAIGLGLHTSGWTWNSMHNKHHATPNKVNFDIDLDTLPLVSFYIGCLENSKRASAVGKPFLRWWLRLQAVTFLPVSIFALTVFWAFYLHVVKSVRHDKLGLAVMVASHIVKPWMFMTFGGTTYFESFLLSVFCLWLSSVYLFGHFALSHTWMPVVDETDDPCWVRYALEHSVDISPGNQLVDWVMGYLNYQVIHHLFPTMPQSYHPGVSEELRAKAKEWGITYTTVDYMTAWRETLGNLHAVGQHYFDELRPSTPSAQAKKDPQ